MLKLNSDYSIENELTEVAGLFFDPQSVDTEIDCFFLQTSPYITIDGEFFAVRLGKQEKKFSRACKVELYKALSAYTGKTFPWGALTGVRPTKLGYEIVSSGGDIVEGLKKYCVSERKAEIIKQIVNNQRGFCRSTRKLNLYIHIPFCTSRCNYCSFVSLTAKGNEKLMEQYAEYLIKEIESGAKLISEQDYTVDSVYIGGGTPTALTESELKAVLCAIPYKGVEFTVEAGRPDTITPQKLDIMQECGVTRISINPQSFSDKTLRSIGRNHTAEDICRVYEAARGRFDINMDLIAGLSDETPTDFAQSVNKAIDLRPQNITVHTLSRKNGSLLKNEHANFTVGVSEMVEDAYNLLTAAGYEPYYLYRQKNMLENLENIGYTLKGKACRNNITTMEEFYSVFACGAGAISKRLFDEGRIERFANVRDVKLYIDQFDERLDKKTKFFL